MTTRLITATAISVLLTCSMFAQASSQVITPNPRTLEELKALTAKLYDAGINGDRKTLEKYLANEFLEIDAVGEFHDKAWNLANFLGNNLKLSYKIEDAKVRESDCVGVLFYVWVVRQEYKDANGSPVVVDSRLNVTDTFVRKSGGWQLLSSHRTRLREGKK